mgnify:CR=1 FL=1
MVYFDKIALQFIRMFRLLYVYDCIMSNTIVFIDHFIGKFKVFSFDLGKILLS